MFCPRTQQLGIYNYNLDHWIMQFESLIGLAIRGYEPLYHALQ